MQSAPPPLCKTIWGSHLFYAQNFKLLKSVKNNVRSGHISFLYFRTETLQHYIVHANNNNGVLPYLSTALLSMISDVTVLQLNFLQKLYNIILSIYACKSQCSSSILINNIVINVEKSWTSFHFRLFEQEIKLSRIVHIQKMICHTKITALKIASKRKVRGGMMVKKNIISRLESSTSRNPRC